MRKTAWMIGVILIIASATGMAQNASKEKAAVASTEKWLGVVDAGQYAESWQETATFFRKTVSQRKWEQSMRSFRKPLGKLVSRRIVSSMYQTSLPGAPDGEYVVMQFNTSFANKESAVETVTAMLDKDGTWRVAGYFIG